MIFNGFKIHAWPFITDASCKCGGTLEQVSNGMLGAALYCPKCESVYEIVMRKIPDAKVTKEFLKQCREELKIDRK
jgi:hypothetical protein